MRLRIGIVCYPTLGGSGIVATELGLAMAARGHIVHFISTDTPRRLPPGVDNVFVHQVRAPNYPVFPQVPYSLGLTSTMVAVATHQGLDVLHAHYAVPHATSAWMAREVLGNGLAVVTTLHGTDITLVGRDESYLPITRHSIQQSDAVTTPSAFLAAETHRQFSLEPSEVPIDVIPNFVDTEVYAPPGRDRPRMQALFGDASLPVLVHVSNFRAVKNVHHVVEAFHEVTRQHEARLLLVGDGPERPRVESLLRRKGLAKRARLVGNQAHVCDLVRESDVFLLPSASESFGLAALEALSCGVPVVASHIGGLPEVIRDGETGFLVPVGDVGAMAERAVLLLSNPDRRRHMGETARRDVVKRFRAEPMVEAYEGVYHRALAKVRG